MTVAEATRHPARAPTKAPSKAPRKGPPAWTDPLFYYAVRALAAVPLIAGVDPSVRVADKIGHWFGSRKFNRKRIDRAIAAIEHGMPGIDRGRAEELALGAYGHLCRLAVEVAYLPRLITPEGLAERVELENVDPVIRALSEKRPLIFTTGHCGNWEVSAYVLGLLGFPLNALYRPLDNKPLDRWLRETRGRRGVTLVDKFGAMRDLPESMSKGEPVAFVCDQNGGDRGLFVPYFGRLASTYKSIALLALKHDAIIVSGNSERLPFTDAGPRYRVVINDVFGPEDYRSHPHPAFYLTARYRRSMEQLIRRVPEQYLWIHRMWKSRPLHERQNKPFPERLKDQLRSLPWMTEDELDGIIRTSDSDRALLAELGTDRLP
ncbi:MAG: lysophospholipid acyltransferase family protein [Planctomycetota bacterium]